MARCPYCFAAVPESWKIETPFNLFSCAACFNPVVAQKNGAGAPNFSRVEGFLDVRAIAPPGSVMGDALQRIYVEIQSIPTLPEVSRQVITLIHDPLAGIKEVADLISQDAPLTLRILAASNSAMFGGLHEITDVHVACSRLGLREVANIVMVASARDLYARQSETTREALHTLWRHSIAAAYCASQLHSLVEASHARSLFTAGLLHDIGKVALLDFLLNKYRGPAGELRKDRALLERVLERFHRLVGLQVAQRWELAPEIRVALCHTGAIESLPGESWARMFHAIRLAHAMAAALGYPDAPATADSSAPSQGEIDSAAALGLSVEGFAQRAETCRAPVEGLLETLPLDM